MVHHAKGSAEAKEWGQKMLAHKKAKRADTPSPTPTIQDTTKATPIRRKKAIATNTTVCPHCGK
jgi:hypothetical protein